MINRLNRMQLGFAVTGILLLLAAAAVPAGVFYSCGAARDQQAAIEMYRALHLTTRRFRHVQEIGGMLAESPTNANYLLYVRSRDDCRDCIDALALQRGIYEMAATGRIARDYDAWDRQVNAVYRCGAELKNIWTVLLNHAQGLLALTGSLAPEEPAEITPGRRAPVGDAEAKKGADGLNANAGALAACIEQAADSPGKSGVPALRALVEEMKWQTAGLSAEAPGDAVRDSPALIQTALDEISRGLDAVDALDLPKETLAVCQLESEIISQLEELYQATAAEAEQQGRAAAGAYRWSCGGILAVIAMGLHVWRRLKYFVTEPAPGKAAGHRYFK